MRGVAGAEVEGGGMGGDCEGESPGMDAGRDAVETAVVTPAGEEAGDDAGEDAGKVVGREGEGEGSCEGESVILTFSFSAVSPSAALPVAVAFALRGESVPATGSMPVITRILNRGTVARATAAAYDRGGEEEEENDWRTEGEGTMTV
jgi:hypothetical protein